MAVGSVLSWLLAPTVVSWFQDKEGFDGVGGVKWNDGSTENGCSEGGAEDCEWFLCAW